MTEPISAFTDAEIEAIDDISMDHIAWIFESQGRGVPFLSDEQKAQLDIIFTTMEPGLVRYHAVLDVVQDTADNEAASEFLAGKATYA